MFSFGCAISTFTQASEHDVDRSSFFGGPETKQGLLFEETSCDLRQLGFVEEEHEPFDEVPCLTGSPSGAKGVAFWGYWAPIGLRG